MKYVRHGFAAMFFLVVALAVLDAEDPKPATNALPTKLTVKEVLAIIGKTEITGQGCGGCTWNGENWGCFVNDYKAMKLPWNQEPQEEMSAGFAFGRKPVEHHLIHFSGPGFSYRRFNDVNELTLQKEEPK